MKSNTYTDEARFTVQVGYEVQHWRALHRAGKTPPAIKLSERKYGWRVSDLIAWQEGKRAAPAAA